MTASPSRSGVSTVSRTQDDQTLQCAVCSHALGDHDPIALRFCRATQAQALARSCICPPN